MERYRRCNAANFLVSNWATGCRLESGFVSSRLEPRVYLASLTCVIDKEFPSHNSPTCIQLVFLTGTRSVAEKPFRCSIFDIEVDLDSDSRGVDHQARV